MTIKKRCAEPVPGRLHPCWSHACDECRNFMETEWNLPTKKKVKDHDIESPVCWCGSQHSWEKAKK